MNPVSNSRFVCNPIPMDSNRHMNFWLPVATYKKLVGLAKKGDRSVSGEARRAIDAHLKRGGKV